MRSSLVVTTTVQPIQKAIALLVLAAWLIASIGAVPMAKADPANWQDDVAFSWGNGYPSNLNNNVQVGAVTFYYPDNWIITSASGNYATVSIRSTVSGEEIGTLAFKSESVYGTSYEYLTPTEVFSYKCAQAFSDENGITARAWSPERIDRGGSPMAKASYATTSNKGLSTGNLYMALTSDGYYYEMLSKVDADEIRGVEEYIDVVWDIASMSMESGTTSWGSAPSSGTGAVPEASTASWGSGSTTPAGSASSTATQPFDEEAFKAQTLANAQKTYAESPWYNPYWKVVGYECGFDYSVDPLHPNVTYEVYDYETPTGWVGSTLNLTLASSHYGSGPDASFYNHWCLICYDSEGEMYYRTSDFVYGVGYVTDLAFYPGYSDCWYVATTGEAVVTDWEGDWVVSSEWSGEPAWTPHFFD